MHAQFSGGVAGNATGFIMPYDFHVLLLGGSILEAQGYAGNFSLVCSGGSNAKLSEFAVGDADVELSGGSRVLINLEGILDADLSGGSRLFYVGNSTLGDINASGGSTVSRLTPGH